MYRVIVSLLEPFPLLLLALGIALIVAWRRQSDQRRRLRWVAVAYLLLLMDCLPAVAYYSAHLLEDRFTRLDELPADTRAIVVLGGGVHPPDVKGGRDRLADNSFYRTQRAAELYHSGPRCLVIVSGGRVEPTDRMSPSSTLMAEYLIQTGVPPADIVIEDRSRNTAENVANSVQILKDRGLTEGVVLTSNATHLVRAELLFRRAGYRVTPIGCAYRTDQSSKGIWSFYPKPNAAAIHQEVAHEVLGIVWLWLRERL